MAQIFCLFNVQGNRLKLGMGMILPATDGKAIRFSPVCFKIILLFLKQESGLEVRSIKTFRTISCGQENIEDLNLDFLI